MAQHITADHLVDAVSKAVTEELFREFNRILQSFCTEEQDRIAIYRTLRYARIRLHVLQKYLPEGSPPVYSPHLFVIFSLLFAVFFLLFVLTSYTCYKKVAFARNFYTSKVVLQNKSNFAGWI